ncbi:MAG: S8 family serine peptidase [Muribaculaceae bacterium]|nr:S8 family serine peptidase [Muribaculaceae bacterium]
MSAILIAFGVSGQVLDLRSRHIADRYKTRAYAHKSRKASAVSDDKVYLPTVMRLAPGTSVADLEAMGVKLLRQRGDLLLAFVPTDRIDQLVTFGGISRMSISEPNRPTLDRALPVSHADQLIGIAPGMPRSWTGEGVVVGLTDDGIDPWHPNFLTPAGEPRIKRFVTYRDTLGVRSVATPLDAASFVTDNDDEWHGTHVLGIMAGSYEDTPYRGIASGAEIVATASMLTDACILDGVEEVIDYAHSVGKPAVVNMSVGSYTGPHDGTSLFNQYLDLLGEEAVIVMSAGNEGWTNMYFNHKFTPSELRKSVCITDHKWYNCQRNYGSTDFWSKDEREFQLALEVRDMADFSMVASFPFKGGSDAREWEIASPGCATTANAEYSEVFDRYYQGYFRITSGVDPDNGRFHIYTSMDMSPTDRIGEMGRYFVTVTIQGKPGVEVDAYADAYQVEFNHGGTGRFAQPNPDRSISDIACGHNVIVVGACTTRNTVPTIGGALLDFTHPNEGEIGVWSSYGVLDDGRSLPHIAAPG